MRQCTGQVGLALACRAGDDDFVIPLNPLTAGQMQHESFAEPTPCPTAAHDLPLMNKVGSSLGIPGHADVGRAHLLTYLLGLLDWAKSVAAAAQ